jgi:hypothetical protein
VQKKKDIEEMDVRQRFKMLLGKNIKTDLKVIQCKGWASFIWPRIQTRSRTL